MECWRDGSEKGASGALDVWCPPLPPANFLSQDCPPKTPMDKGGVFLLAFKVICTLGSRV